MTSCLRGWRRWPSANICQPNRPCRLLSTSAPSASTPVAIYRPRRSFLYIPASNAKMLSKLATLQADTLCLDIEDGVALTAKPSARQNISHALTQHSAHFLLASPSTTAPPAAPSQPQPTRRPELVVRVNPASSAECASDLRALLACDVLPHGVVVPKLESSDELRYVYETLRKHRALQEGGLQPQRTIALVALVETARGLVNLGATLAAVSSASLPLQALIFGGDDYAADIGATRTPSNSELLTARQLVVANAAAQRLQAIDLVHTDLRDTAALTADCRSSYGAGFAGRQCIHPSQVAVADDEYVGGRERLVWSRRVVEGWEANERAGVGAWTLDGKMIDLPTVKNAQKVLRHARACGVDIYL